MTPVIRCANVTVFHASTFRMQPKAPDVLCVCLSDLKEALVQCPEACQSLFRPIATADGETTRQLALQLAASSPGPRQVAQMMTLWLSSAPSIILPLEMQLVLLGGAVVASPSAQGLFRVSDVTADSRHRIKAVQYRRPIARYKMPA